MPAPDKDNIQQMLDSPRYGAAVFFIPAGHRMDFGEAQIGQIFLTVSSLDIGRGQRI